MESRFGMKFRRPAEQLRISRENYAVPNMKNRERSFLRQWEKWRVPSYAPLKDDLPQEVLVVDFDLFKRISSGSVRCAIQKYEALIQQSKTPEGAAKIIDEEVLELIKEGLWLKKGIRFNVAYSLTIDDFTQSATEQELIKNHYVWQEDIPELIRAISIAQNAYSIVKKQVSIEQILKSKYPAAEYEFIQLAEKSAWSTNLYGKRILQYYKKHEDSIEYSPTDYCLLSELVDHLSLEQREELYSELYSELLGNDPLFHLYLEKYAVIYTDEQCEELRNRALENYDINMQYCSSLDKAEFQSEINKFLKSHPDFQKVKDLHLFNKRQGVYIMVLGDLCQAYIGISKNIFSRIQQHWLYNQKPLDRLVMGDVDKSIMSIDSFLPLDTTEILVQIMPDASEELLSETEKELVSNSIKSKYLLNRTYGGTGIDNLVPRYRDEEA
ncbi:MAG: hypothetical protein IJM46_08085 [Oscillospiraceae bacterium]|nr:hypothetical protein [Oscillospiraceae bacterium]